MHNFQRSSFEKTQQSRPDVFASETAAVPVNTNLSRIERDVLDFAWSFRFATDARVSGYLINADIGPTSYGHLYGADMPPGENFITFEAIGIDWRGGYDIVRTRSGVAYVIVTYTPHARERGLSLLKRHIGANPGHYAALSRILGEPWPYMQQMISHLHAE